MISLRWWTITLSPLSAIKYTVMKNIRWWQPHYASLYRPPPWPWVQFSQYWFITSTVLSTEEFNLQINWTCIKLAYTSKLINTDQNLQLLQSRDCQSWVRSPATLLEWANLAWRQITERLFIDRTAKRSINVIRGQKDRLCACLRKQDCSTTAQVLYKQNIIRGQLCGDKPLKYFWFVVLVWQHADH